MGSMMGGGNNSMMGGNSGFGGMGGNSGGLNMEGIQNGWEQLMMPKSTIRSSDSKTMMWLCRVLLRLEEELLIIWG